MTSFTFSSPTHIASQVASRMKARRLASNWSRKTLAERSGVPESTIKHFETQGSISFESLIRIALALGAASEFAGLFPEQPVVNIEQILAPQRQRGRQ